MLVLINFSGKQLMFLIKKKMEDICVLNLVEICHKN